MLKAENVSKSFYRKGRGSNVFTAVSEVSLTLAEGEIALLKGRSGCGKSTLLNMLAGLSRPSGGRVLLGDRDIYSMSDRELSRLRNEKFGIIPQMQSAVHSLTVMENVLLPYTLYNELKDEHRAYAIGLLEELGIAALGDVRPAELSGGEMRRMAIARALVRRPEIILADEPTGDLDDDNTERVFELLKAAADRGAAVLLVTHEQTENYKSLSNARLLDILAR